MISILKKKRKKNNKGVTLIEIVVTIAILGIVAVPLLNSFAVGMRTNNEARKTEEVNQMAQDVAEAFRAADLDKLSEQLNKSGIIQIGDYKDIQASASGTAVDADANHEKYELVFHNKVGSFMEKDYYVTATLTESREDSIPDMVDVGNSANVIKICEEYYKNDSIYKGTASGKETSLNIMCNSLADNKYQYRISLDAKYDATEVKDIYTIEKVILKDGSKNNINIYLLCNYFNTSSVLSTDKIKINYQYTGAGTDLPCNVYLYGQEITDGGHGVSLNKDNVTITNNGGLKVYSNVEGISGAETTTARMKELYTVYSLHLDVREGSTTGNVAAKLDTTIIR